MTLSAKEGAKKLYELLYRGEGPVRPPDMQRVVELVSTPPMRRHQIIGIATDEELRERALLMRQADKQRAQKAPKHSANYKGPRKVTCLCGTEFEVPRSYGKDAKKYCSAACRKKYGGTKSKYKFTTEVDAKICAAYAGSIGMSRLPALQVLSREIGVPSWAIRRRALALGASVAQLFPKGRKPCAWSDEEKRIVTESAALSLEIIGGKLRKAGYARSKNAIKVFIARSIGRKPKIGYSATALAARLGVDSHSVTRWIRQKLLKAQAAGTVRKPQQGGDAYLVSPADAREFCIRYVALLDFRKVDKFWLVELLAGNDTELVN